jgi:hypothetical protein
MERNPPWEANGHSDNEEIPAFYVTRRFIAVFTRARYWSQLWATWIQFTSSHPISPRSTLILSSHLRPGLQNGFFSSDLLTKILCTFIIPAMRATWPIHLILLVFSSLPPLPPSKVQITSSACSQTPSIHVFPLVKRLKWVATLPLEDIYRGLALRDGGWAWG